MAGTYKIVDKRARHVRRGGHPSKPGQYPRKVTGWLRRNVVMEVDLPSMRARIGTNVPYGVYLELGTRKMAKRPFMMAGVMEFWDGMQALLQQGEQ
jgi:hypothetical protein